MWIALGEDICVTKMELMMGCLASTNAMKKQERWSFEVISERMVESSHCRQSKASQASIFLRSKFVFIALSQMEPDARKLSAEAR